MMVLMMIIKVVLMIRTVMEVTMALMSNAAVSGHNDRESMMKMLSWPKFDLEMMELFVVKMIILKLATM